MRRRQKLRFLQNFWRLRLKFKGLLGERRRSERKYWNILQESGVFMHFEEKAAEIVDLLLGWGRVLEHPQHPPRYGPVINRTLMPIAEILDLSLLLRKFPVMDTSYVHTHTCTV